MKAQKQNPSNVFIPVILTLETQSEVDAMFTLFNTSVLARFLEKYVVGEYPYNLLDDFTKDEVTNPMYDELQDDLEEEMKIQHEMKTQHEKY